CNDAGPRAAFRDSDRRDPQHERFLDIRCDGRLGKPWPLVAASVGDPRPSVVEARTNDIHFMPAVGAVVGSQHRAARGVDGETQLVAMPEENTSGLAPARLTNGLSSGT